MKKFFLIIIPAILVMSCEMRPKKIQADETSIQFDHSEEHRHEHKDYETAMVDKITAVTEEVMHSEKYTYLKVSDGNRRYWIATASADIEPGTTISYHDGLLRVNFESQEFKRVFDTIYLVNSVRVEGKNPAGPPTPEKDIDADTKNYISEIQGSISLDKLFASRSEYDGKIVTVAGNVIKVNRNIMGMDWVHITDNSIIGGKPAELTITTNSDVSTGQKAVFKGKISLNRDFGYGYRYDILMEEAERL